MKARIKGIRAVGWGHSTARMMVMFAVVMFLVLSVTAMASMPRGPVLRTPLPRPFLFDNNTHADANLIDMFVTNHGSFAWDLTTTDPGFIYPKGTSKTAIYASGLWLGAKINGDIHVTVAEYSEEYSPGPMMNGGPATDPNDPSYRVYVIDPSSKPGDPDYDQWPADQGAPVDQNGDPKLFGDQTLWCVYNDADPLQHTNGAGSTDPLGVEVQQTVFAYNRTGALGNIVFLKFLIINKGSNFLQDAYVALWSDPDLGGASDDLVGCDTALSVGFCYNATNNDQVYGTTPPCAGYDFFQGPISPSLGDTAYVSGAEYPNFRNLPMTAFNKYINGTDPRSALESYEYMEGLNAVEGGGAPYINPVTGDTTTFAVSGDPVTGTGWLDDTPADRRFLLASGPFDLYPTSEYGDSVIIGVTAQEVVAAIVMGQGTDRLNSVTVMKHNDEAAQSVFNANFNIPNPPPRPTVYVQARDRYINLIWGTEADGNVQINEALGQEFDFEGYNVYQAPSVAGPWTKIATFDVVNDHDYIDPATGDTLSADVGLIYMDVFEPAAGGTERLVIQRGNNTGIVHNIVIDNDALLGGKLVNYKQYFFAVTAYNFEVNNAVPYFLGPNVIGWISETLENAQNPITVIPGSQGLKDSLAAEHIAGNSDGSVVVDYIPELENDVTGHRYQVTFDSLEGEIAWKLTDLVTTHDVLDSEFNQSGGYGYKTADGIMVRVMGPAIGIKGILETVAGGTPLDPPDNVAYSLNSTGDWYVGSDQGDNFARLNWQGLIGIDNWEFRFFDDPAEGSEYYNYLTDELFSDRAPFQVWNMGSTPTSTPRRDQFEVIDDDESGGWSYGDRIYVLEVPYVEPLPAVAEYVFPDDFHIGRIIFNDYSGATSHPSGGTVVLFETNKPNAIDDVFEFQTRSPWEGLAWDLDRVKVVPNPYYGHSQYELNPYDKRVKFTHLPKECTIRIFTLGGDHVRTLEKNDTSTELFWDLETKFGIPVASGIYIWYLDAPGIGTKEGKAAVFIERETLNTF
jgi:hypothetical protein